MTTTARPPTRPTVRALTRAQLRALDADLRSERARLERSLGIDAGETNTLAQASQGSIPGGGEGDDLAIAFQGRAHARHQTILDALQRIETGTYGVCVGCHTPIPYGRLLVMPESAHCVACGPRV
jgi:RNA polymerase-binding transcription factor DksA